MVDGVVQDGIFWLETGTGTFNTQHILIMLIEKVVFLHLLSFFIIKAEEEL